MRDCNNLQYVRKVHIPNGQSETLILLHIEWEFHYYLGSYYSAANSASATLMKYLTKQKSFISPQTFLPLLYRDLSWKQNFDKYTYISNHYTCCIIAQYTLNLHSRNKIRFDPKKSNKPARACEGSSNIMQ